MDKRKQRIDELEEIINSARRERDSLKKEISDEQYKTINNERRKYIGKCFKLINDKKRSESYSNIYAFKIISFDRDEDDRLLSDVRCLTLCNGYRYTCWQENGITSQVISLWSPDKRRLMSSVNDTKTIDCFKEISNEEFTELLNKNIEDIKKLV